MGNGIRRFRLDGWYNDCQYQCIAQGVQWGDGSLTLHQDDGSGHSYGTLEALEAGLKKSMAYGYRIRWEDEICPQCGAVLFFAEAAGRHCTGCGAGLAKERYLESRPVQSITMQRDDMREHIPEAGVAKALDAAGDRAWRALVRYEWPPGMGVLPDVLSGIVRHAIRNQNLQEELGDWTLADLPQRLRDVIYIDDCHVSGNHDPEHTPYYVCDLQLRRLAERVLAVLGIDEHGATPPQWSKLPRRINRDPGSWFFYYEANRQHAESLEKIETLLRWERDGLQPRPGPR